MTWPAVVLLLSLGGASAPDGSLTLGDVLTWPRARADRFGCFLERELGHRDRHFHCDLTGYVNAGDPCRKVQAWYEGPAFPADQVKRVHPLVREIDLSWEHGELQAVWIIFEKKLDPRELRRELRLPDPDGALPANVASLQVDECGDGSTCLYLESFDHMGAGDADCEGAR